MAELALLGTWPGLLNVLLSEVSHPNPCCAGLKSPWGWLARGVGDVDFQLPNLQPTFASQMDRLVSAPPTRPALLHKPCLALLLLQGIKSELSPPGTWPARIGLLRGMRVLDELALSLSLSFLSLSRSLSWAWGPVKVPGFYLDRVYFGEREACVRHPFGCSRKVYDDDFRMYVRSQIHIFSSPWSHDIAKTDQEYKGKGMIRGHGPMEHTATCIYNSAPDVLQVSTTSKVSAMDRAWKTFVLKLPRYGG